MDDRADGDEITPTGATPPGDDGDDAGPPGATAATADGDGTASMGATPARRRRRWPYWVGGVIVVLLAAGLLGRFVWLPTYRPDLEAGERYGVDVSNHQGRIDWERVAADDMDFAYIKATEGGDFVDRSFERNWEGAEAAGLDRGAYHFFTLCKPGAEQAENFLRTVPADPELPPAIDLELGGNCAARPSKAWLDRELDDFLTAVESATGERVLLYIGPEFEDIYPIKDDLDRPIWHRRLVLRPDGDPWWIWQFMSVGAVDGVDGAVDVNVMRGTEPPGP
jgi:lysozyme